MVEKEQLFRFDIINSLRKFESNLSNEQQLNKNLESLISLF